MNNLTQVGQSGVAVLRIGFGATVLANMSDIYGYSVSEDRTLTTIRAFLAKPDRLIDRSHNYGLSMRDQRIASTFCGVRRTERIQEMLEWTNWPISDKAWDELLALSASSEDPEASREYSPG